MQVKKLYQLSFERQCEIVEALIQNGFGNLKALSDEIKSRDRVSISITALSGYSKLIRGGLGGGSCPDPAMLNILRSLGKI